MRYLVNAPARKSRKKKSGKRRSPAQRAATRKMRAALAAKQGRRTSAKKRKRSTTRRKPVMAKRKARKRGAARKTSSRRRRGSKKRRSPINRLRRNSVYLTNPRRKRGRRRRGYSRNPSYIRQAIQISKDTAAVLVGGAAGRTIGSMLPTFDSPIAEAAKGVLIAIGIRVAAARFLGADVARFAAAGAMQVPLKNLVVSFAPQAAPFLGDYDLASLSSYAGAGALNGGGVYTEGISSYSDSLMGG